MLLNSHERCCLFLKQERLSPLVTRKGDCSTTALLLFLWKKHLCKIVRNKGLSAIFLKLMISPLCMCVVQFFLHCFFKSIFIVETKTNSVVWEISHCRFFALVALHFQKCQAVSCYILVDKQMLEKEFCSNIAPSSSSGNLLFYKAECMGRSCPN